MKVEAAGGAGMAAMHGSKANPAMPSVGLLSFAFYILQIFVPG